MATGASLDDSALLSLATVYGSLARIGNFDESGDSPGTDPRLRLSPWPARFSELSRS